MKEQRGLDEVWFGFYRIRDPRNHRRLGIGPYLFGPCECGCSKSYGFGIGFLFFGVSVVVWTPREVAQ
jgi:hypothetical protein